MYVNSDGELVKRVKSAALSYLSSLTSPSQQYILRLLFQVQLLCPLMRSKCEENESSEPEDARCLLFFTVLCSNFKVKQGMLIKIK